MGTFNTPVGYRPYVKGCECDDYCDCHFILYDEIDTAVAYIDDSLFSVEIGNHIVDLSFSAKSKSGYYSGAYIDACADISIYDEKEEEYYTLDGVTPHDEDDENYILSSSELKEVRTIIGLFISHASRMNGVHMEVSGHWCSSYIEIDFMTREEFVIFHEICLNDNSLRKFYEYMRINSFMV